VPKSDNAVMRITAVVNSADNCPTGSGQSGYSWTLYDGSKLRTVQV
jgi:hypothetical protein